MTVYGILDNLCAVSNDLLFLVKQQAELLAQADIPDEVSEELKKKRDKVEDDLDIIEYRMRHL